jgi:acyl-coenzyme A thioesterase PaaI-like protein
MNIKYLLPIKEGIVVCEGSFLKQGKTIGFLQSHMYREDEKLAAYASATWLPLKK